MSTNFISSDFIKLVLLGIIFCTAAVFWLRCRARFPPGPRGLPFLGNIFDLPKEYEWLHWAKFNDRYGPVSSVSVMGTRIVLLNSLEACVELLERRSAKYSNRPRLPFAGEMIGWDQHLILSQYGDRFRSMRKMLFGSIGTKAAVSVFAPIQELETRYFLSRVQENPTSLLNNIRLSTGAILLKMSHGYTIETSRPDPLIKTIDTAADEFHTATLPGVWAVDIIPWLRYVPSWVPGSHFIQVAKQFRKTLEETTNRPHQFVERMIKEKKALTSITSKILESDLNENENDIAKCASASLYGGGTDTVTATISAFFLAMTLYPDVQKKAQAEIDEVVGRHRLPTLEDRERLPYLAAILKEVLRWHIAGPLGIPHCTTEDDIYNGYFIPKGSLVVANAWQIAHDEAIYFNASKFWPERFLNENNHSSELDPHAFAFGFGRRRCPAIELADSIVFICMAMSLSVFDIIKAKDEDGNEITPVVGCTSGTVSHPSPYQCSLCPRSNDALQLIRSVHIDQPSRKSDADFFDLL